MRVMRDPFIQFLVLGALVFAVYGVLRPAGEGVGTKRIVVDAAAQTSLYANFRKQFGRSPSRAEMEALVQADVAHEDSHRENALFDAVKYRSPVAARLLLAQGVPSHTRNEHDITPLLYAVEDGQMGLVQLLLAEGVDINIGSRRYGVPLCIARQHHLVEMEHYLLQHGATPSDCQQYRPTVSGWLP